LVYSGDTRPCDLLIEAGKNATILIHEGTFDDSLQQDAVMKNHSTVAEAIEVGQK
jgi:ribonuclease Z